MICSHVEPASKCYSTTQNFARRYNDSTIHLALSNSDKMYACSFSCQNREAAIRSLDVLGSTFARMWRALLQAQSQRAGVKFLKHNVRDDFDDVTDIARLYRIKNVPCFVFFSGGAMVSLLTQYMFLGFLTPYSEAGVLPYTYNRHSTSLPKSQSSGR